MSQKTDTQTKIMMFRSFIQNNETEGGDSTKVIALFDKVLNVPQPSSEIARCVLLHEFEEDADRLCDFSLQKGA